MNDTEHIGTGRKITRDEFGRFKSVELSSEVASEMGKARWLGETSAERLLAEQGYNQTDQAPEYIVVMAQQAVKHTAAMAHWRRVHSLASETSETAGFARPRPGEACGLCGTYNFSGISGRSISDLLQELRDLEGEET